MLTLVGITEVVGVDIGKDRLLVQVVAHQCRHVRIDGLVVCDSVADGVGDADVARSRNVDEAGNAEHAVWTQVNGVEVVVVDAAVDHVDHLRASGGAHPDSAVAAVEIAAFHELHTHVSRKEGMLVVGRVVHSRGEHDHVRVDHILVC